VGPAVELPVGLSRMVPDELRGSYEAWLRQTFGPGALKAGLVPKDADTLDTEAMRADLIRAVAWRGREPKLIAEAVTLSDKWRDLPQSIRGDVLMIAADASPAVFDRTMKEVVTERDRVKRQEMLRALATVRDPQRHKVALGLMLDSKLDPRETLAMLFGGGGGRGGGNGGDETNLVVSQEFFREHQAEIMKTMPQDGTSGPFARISGLFTGTCDAGQRDAIVGYVKKTFGGMAGGSRIIAQNLEQMDQCIARRKVIEPELRAWLTSVKTKAKP
jgi:alanyl aminopeptidase